MIETHRLTLREWRDEDRAPFIAMCRSAAVMAHIGGPITDDETDAAIAKIKACQAEHGHCFWAMERKSDGAFVGFCGFKIARHAGVPTEGDVEIGWRLAEAAWGQGYAREAAEACLAWAGTNLSNRRVVATTVTANVRSWGLMERLGMERRPELDFGHPHFAPDHPLYPHIVYVAYPPSGAA